VPSVHLPADEGGNLQVAGHLGLGPRRRPVERGHPRLVERLVAAHVPVDSVHPEKLKLEDVFLRLTKGIVQ